MKDLDTYLKEVRKRAEAATEGPWDYLGGNTLRIETDYNISFETTKNFEDARFIAHARTDVPRLLEMINYLLNTLVNNSVLSNNETWMKLQLKELERIARGEE